MLAAVHEVLAPESLIGCGAGGVIGHGREIEGGSAVSVWAANLGEDGTATTFHATVEELEVGTGALTGMADLAGAGGAILLARPGAPSRPTPVLRFLSESTPMLPLLGGLASGRTRGRRDGAVLRRPTSSATARSGARLDGVEVLPMVSQGAAPIGPELTITAGEGHVIGELAGKPALEKLRETIDELAPEDLRLIQGGLLVGIVVDSNKPDYLQGDFLVRGLSAPIPRPARSPSPPTSTPARSCGCTPATPRAPTATCARRSSIRMTALGGRTPAGALRLRLQRPRAQRCSAAPTTTPRSVADALAGAPAAGFFAAGEIGPVGGGYFLHSFTATVAVFA